MTAKKKKSLVGYIDSNWKKNFKWWVRKHGTKKEYMWIDNLRHSQLSMPSVYRNNKPAIGCVQAYPSSDKSKKVRITIEEM